MELPDFVRQSGLDSRTNLIDIVGIPQIVFYADTPYLYDDSEVDEPPDGYSIIIIPHIDLSVDKHTKRSSNGARPIIDIVWIITLDIAELAHDIIGKNPTRITREAIVRQIFEVCSKVSTNCPRLLEDALKSYRPKGANTRTENLETAQGPPNTETSRQQVLTLWKKNIRTLHVGYTRAEKAAWLKLGND